jgi:sugar-specific transcriptional regulator TrmB
MLIPQEYVEILVELGLTHTEAKVYLALLCLNDATARKIHTELNTARQDVYPILSDLEKKGLIEKVIAKPTRFRPIPAKDAISILLQKRKQQYRRLRKKAIQHFSNFNIACIDRLPLDKNVRFVLLSKNETSPTGHIDKPGKAVDGAKKNVMGLITLGLFMKVKLSDESIWKNAVERGVKFKFIISVHSNEQAELSLDPVLKNTDSFKVRWMRTGLQATVLLVDEREAFCRIGVNVENPVLWSLNANFVALIKDYLTMKWKSLAQS